MSRPQCAHGSGQCADWPDTDQLGRTKCTRCRCYTFDPTGIHSWCDPARRDRWYSGTHWTLTPRKQ